MSERKPDALELLEADHRLVRELLAEYRELAAQAAPAARRKALAEQICMELAIHTRLEEELFYPAVEEAVGDELLDAAEVQHAGARDLIAQVLSMDPDEDLYDARVAVLGESIEHHLRVEREQVFPRVRASSLDLARMAERLRVRKGELQAVTDALREDLLVSLTA